MGALSELDWQIRLAIYHAFVATGQAPTAALVAPTVGLSVQQVSESFLRLHDHHAILLQPDGTVRMANPLSGVPTAYKVNVDGGHLWANCAWDSLGIPAMLHSDALIEAQLPDSTTIIRYEVRAGQLFASDELRVHFTLPFTRWYDDLIHT